ncbi:hypothetical protein [Streptomyces nigra]|uniref:hypothetical protein n=1 Tax=Streptomyces nigra TaxID=1827580 RepID=UPI000F4D510E|nr:hypothetical protein [Streptomyces nigra]
MTDVRVRIESDLLTGPLVGLWGTLLDLSEKVPQDWTLIGGQMVLLHGLEHGRTPPAASLDLDVLADVISDQQSLRTLVAALEEMGFESTGVSPEGKTHRYKRDDSAGALIVDLLAPDNLGQRANLTTTPPGTTLEVPGGRQAVQRSESICAQLGDRVGTIHRPNLLGAIVGKAAALGIAASSKEKHYRDLAFLLSLPVNPFDLKPQLTKSDLKKLKLAGSLLDADHAAWRALREAEVQADGQAMYRILTSA